MKNTLCAIGLLGAVAASAGCYATVSDGNPEPRYYVRHGHYVDVSPGVRAYRIRGTLHTYDVRARRYVRYHGPAVRVHVR
jgi:hypothetical protein